MAKQNVIRKGTYWRKPVHEFVTGNYFSESYDYRTM